MSTVKIRNILLGEGVPKIAAAKPDLMEWRIDYYAAGIEDTAQLIDTGRKIRELIGELPLLVTFRTKSEGGVCQLEENRYLDLVDQIIVNRLGDAVDIELFHEEKRIESLVSEAKNYNVVVIMSNHDFEKVPAKDVIEFRLKKMANLGADVPKLACMPHNVEDVLTLLEATNEVHNEIENPIITRIAGQVFGSSLSFGAVGKSSAPGQLSIEELRNAEKYLAL